MKLGFVLTSQAGVNYSSTGFPVDRRPDRPESMEVACSPLIANIMEICSAVGVAEVLRIIPHPTRDIGLQIMSFFHYGNDVCIRTCASATEAREMLQSESAQRLASSMEAATP